MIVGRTYLTMAGTVATVAVIVSVAHIGASGTLRSASPSKASSEVTQALFGFDSPADGPFPTDWFTVPDHTNLTHRRISLPMAGCTLSDCQDVAVLNELDGFNLRPRLSVPFNGPIDPTTVTSTTMFLVSLGLTGPGQDYMPWGTVVGIDQVVWDQLTNTLHVESDQLLAQHTRFALIVTRGILDRNGAAIGATDSFRGFRADIREGYKQDLLDAVQAARQIGVREADIAVASVFTTQSATAVLEKIRDQIHAATPPDPADFSLGPNGQRTVFNFDQVTSIAWNEERVVTHPPTFTTELLDLSLLRPSPPNASPAAVGIAAFGKYSSPDYEKHPGEYIPPVGTRRGVPEVQGVNDIYFNLFLPSGMKPVNGWPVAIVGHGISHSRNSMPLTIVRSLAEYGIATIAINAAGHGYGPEGTLTVNGDGGTVTFKAGGRGIDQNADGKIGSAEGLNAASPRSIIFASDGFRQTDADLMQLVRVLGVGVDVDGDGTSDLDASRIYYFGNSYGAAYGTNFVAVEPNVRTAVLAVPADPIPIGNLGPENRRSVGGLLASRQPRSLLNPPGVSVIWGLPVGTPRYNDNMPLRDQVPLPVQLTNGMTDGVVSPVTNTVPGAMAIQALGENLEWAGEAGSPAAYAAHLRRAPLAGVGVKSVLFVVAKGDESAPNPTTTTILRAGDLAPFALYYLHDVYRQDHPTVVRNPHAVTTSVADPIFGPISLAVQDYARRFFLSGGTEFPVSSRYFEFPIPTPLPEGLNYKQ